MKYVALMSIDEPSRWSQWHSGPTNNVYRSEGYNTKKEAKDWIDRQYKNLKAKGIKYSNKIPSADYLIKEMIIMVNKKDLEIQHGNVTYSLFDSFIYIVRKTDDVSNEIMR